MTGLSPAIVADLVGKRFEWNGRGPDGFDCYGLVREILMRLGWSDVPTYGPLITAQALSIGRGASIARAEIIAAAESQWRRLTLAKPGCVVLFRDEYGIGSHVGVMIDGDRFLHTSEQLGAACIERLSNPLFSRLVIGFYEWDGAFALDPEIFV